LLAFSWLCKRGARKIGRKKEGGSAFRQPALAYSYGEQFSGETFSDEKQEKVEGRRKNYEGESEEVIRGQRSEVRRKIDPPRPKTRA
jgi:hypothetical protein